MEFLSGSLRNSKGWPKPPIWIQSAPSIRPSVHSFHTSWHKMGHSGSLTRSCVLPELHDMEDSCGVALGHISLRCLKSQTPRSRTCLSYSHHPTYIGTKPRKTETWSPGGQKQSIMCDLRRGYGFLRPWSTLCCRLRPLILCGHTSIKAIGLYDWGRDHYFSLLDVWDGQSELGRRLFIMYERSETSKSSSHTYFLSGRSGI